MWLITVLSWFNRRGQFIFHIGPGRFGQLFSLNKLNHHLKNCILYLLALSLCNIKISLMIWIFQVWQIGEKKTGRGKNLFTALYTVINLRSEVNIVVCDLIMWLLMTNLWNDNPHCLDWDFLPLICMKLNISHIFDSVTTLLYCHSNNPLCEICHSAPIENELKTPSHLQCWVDYL